MGSGYNGENFTLLNREHRRRQALKPRWRRVLETWATNTLIVVASLFLWWLTLYPVIMPIARWLGW